MSKTDILWKLTVQCKTILESAWHVDKVAVKETGHALTEQVFKLGSWLEPAQGDDEPSITEVHSPG